MAKPKKRLDPSKIYTTKDYSIFKFKKGNRTVTAHNLSKVVTSIKDKELNIPIYVDSDMRVIDGQHRLAARQKLGLPVQYIWIGDNVTLADIQRLNSAQSGWSVRDFCESQIVAGNKNYEIYKHFINKYRLTHEVSVSLLMFGLGSAKGTSKIFKNGVFEVRHYELAERVARQLGELSEIFPAWRTQKFLRSMLKLLAHPNFEWKRFMQKVRARGLKQQATIDDYIDHIEKLYNFKVSEDQKVGLRYAK